MLATTEMKFNHRPTRTVRHRVARQRLHDPLDDYSDLDSMELESLLHDYSEEGHAVAHQDVDSERTNHEHEPDVHRETPDRYAPRGHANELADTWMLKGGRAPLLTAAQELVLAKRVEHGDQKAREELVDKNVRLVASVARRYLGRGLPLEDLMQEGVIGLLRAIEKYNYRKGYRFSTYATHWIRQSVSRALANQGRSIRLPAHVVDAIGRMVRIREELFHKLGRPATRQELAEAAGITEKKLVLLLRSAANPLSLETPIGPEGEGRLGDFIPADEDASPSNRAFHFMVHDELEHALKSLAPRERAVIILRYGLFGEEPHTLEETGRRLHITRERSRQIESKAMEKLKRPHTVGRLVEALG